MLLWCSSVEMKVYSENKAITVFESSLLSLSTMTRDELDTIDGGSIIDLWEEHDCFGKRVAAVLDAWKDRGYDVARGNCIHFAEALLKAIGLKSDKLDELQSQAQARLREAPFLAYWLGGRNAENQPAEASAQEAAASAQGASDGVTTDGAAVAEPVVPPDVGVDHFDVFM